MRLKNYYREYCSGCGLCIADENVQFQSEHGFDYPIIINSKQVKFCKSVCPVNGINYNQPGYTNLWGDFKMAYSGWAIDEQVRFTAATGGVITGLCIYLIESKLVDGILQIGSDNNDPLGIQLYFNEQVDDILKCSTSRYITGITFRNIQKYFEGDKKYAVVGKPCDMEALTNYINLRQEYKKYVKYRLTFFCAGAPSKHASLKLANSLGVTNGEIKKIRYRGNGWPGLATIVSGNNEEYTMPYIDSWNHYLGRDIRKMCKFCMNGIGEFSDVSCGDLWEVDNENKPIFVEKDGVNIIFSRTDLGNELINKAKEAGYIHIENYKDIEKLKYIQPNHHNMRTTMLWKVIGMKLLGKAAPNYNWKHLQLFSKDIPIKKSIRIIFGTIKRILKKSI